MKTENRKEYEKRSNIWRHNVPKKISRFISVPDWFFNMDSLKVGKTSISKLLKSKKMEYKEVKKNWFLILIDFVKKIFKF